MLMNPQQVRTMLGVSNHSLKYWRDTTRLPGGASNPLYLPAIPDPHNPNCVWYDQDVVMDFVCRNKRYADHVLAQFAPTNIVRAVTDPLPIPLTPTAPVQPQPHGLFGIHTHQPQPAESLE